MHLIREGPSLQVGLFIRIREDVSSLFRLFARSEATLRD